MPGRLRATFDHLYVDRLLGEQGDRATMRNPQAIAGVRSSGLTDVIWGQIRTFDDVRVWLSCHRERTRWRTTGASAKGSFASNSACPRHVSLPPKRPTGEHRSRSVQGQEGSSQRLSSLMERPSASRPNFERDPCFVAAAPEHLVADLSPGLRLRQMTYGRDRSGVL
jgi:hypothetical protein